MNLKDEFLQLLQIKINSLNISLDIIKNSNLDKNNENFNLYSNFKFNLIEIQNYLVKNQININTIKYLNSLLNTVNLFFENADENSKKYYEENPKEQYNNIISEAKHIFSKTNNFNFTLKILKKFDCFQNNLVFIGANGSGKSSFASTFKHYFSNHCVNISAQRILNIPNNTYIENINNVKEELLNKQNKDISNKNNDYINIIIDEFSVLLKNLFSENYKIANEVKRQHQNKELIINDISILDNVIKIWNQIIIHRNLSSDGMNLIIKTIDETEEYNANSMSDGEKVVLFCIGQVLLSPQNSFIVIDEAELFLNKNIVNRLWNELENIRNDCKFIYLTHDLDFAINRPALKIWMKAFGKDNFDFEKIDDNEDIPPKLIMELLGSQKPILFCEGKNDGKSFDLQIFSILFPKFTIKAVESCSNVINYTKAFNKIMKEKNRAFGIIDRDFHPEERLIKLEKENIFNFGFSEIENLFLEENFLKDFIENFYSNDNSFEIFKEKVLEELSKNKEMQATHFTTFAINYIYEESHINKSNNLEKLKENFNKFNNQIKIDEIYNNRLKELETIIQEKDYLKVIKIFNNKGLIKIVEQILEIKNYIERSLKHLNKNKQSREYLLKYFNKKLLENSI